MRVLCFIIIVLLNFSCVGQKEVAWVDDEYIPKNEMALKYVFFNAVEYEHIIKMNTGFVHLSVEIDEKGTITSINSLKTRILPKNTFFSGKEKEHFKQLVKKYVTFHNPNKQKATFNYNINIKNIISN